jgi:hypothetical protein
VFSYGGWGITEEAPAPREGSAGNDATRGSASAQAAFPHY